MGTNDVRFYLTAIVSVTTLAVVSASVLTLAGVNESVTASIVAPVAGFSAMIVIQFRSAAATNAKVENVAEKADLAADNARKLAATVAVKTQEHSDQLAEIKQTAQEVKATTEDLKVKAEQIQASADSHGAGLNNLAVVLQVTPPPISEKSENSGTA